MFEVIQFLKELGSFAIDIFWLPVAVWTALALVSAVLLKYFSSLSALYQYHFRVAVLAALPTGILAAPLIHSLLSSDTASAAPALFVIQNPIPVQVARAEAGITWGDPALWVGIASVFVAIITLTAIARLFFNFIQLKSFMNQLKNKTKPAEQINQHITVYVSDAIETPCTFGRGEKSVVIPEHLKERPEKYNMALRHELMHIQHNDYAINSFMQVIRALFYFHPSVHYLIHQAGEYREIYCDIKVLSDADISQKSYASLLFELAPKPVFKNTAAVQMAVNPSTLKKRIQTMKKQTHITPSLKKSIVITLLLGLTLTGFMACSDMTSDGLTTAEVKQMQQNMLDAPPPPKAQGTVHLDADINLKEAPLYVLNGQIIDSSKRNIIARIKPKYIKSIKVLKGEAAVEAYGMAGKNGVVKIELYAKEHALNNLKPVTHTNPPTPPRPASDKKIYVAVENMPKLQNRKAFYTGMEYPEACKQSNGGTVYVQFTVTETGETANFHILKGLNAACNQATLKYVKTHAEFSPGTQNGEPVNVQFTIPIAYRSK